MPGMGQRVGIVERVKSNVARDMADSFRSSASKNQTASGQLELADVAMVIEAIVNSHASEAGRPLLAGWSSDYRPPRQQRQHRQQR